MIKLTIAVGGESFEERDHPSMRQFCDLTIATAVALTPDKAKSNNVGTWSTEIDIFYGPEKAGRYYVKNVLATITDEERWSGVHLPTNPVGFFFHAKGDDPVLILEGFNPMKVKAGEEGDATVLIKKGSDFTRRYSKWTVDK